MDNKETTREEVIETLDSLKYTYPLLKEIFDVAIKDVKAWDEITKSGMPTLVIDDCAYILTRGHIEAMIKYNEEQNNKDLEEFGAFLKELVKNDR